MDRRAPKELNAQRSPAKTGKIRETAITQSPQNIDTEERRETNRAEEISAKTAGQLRRRFNNLVRGEKLSEQIERAVPYTYGPLGAAMTFVTGSGMGMWDYIPHAARPYTLAAFAAAAIVPYIFTKLPNPFGVSRADALKRLDHNSHTEDSDAARMIDSALSGNYNEEQQQSYASYISQKLSENIDQFRTPLPRPQISDLTAFAAITLAMATSMTAFTVGPASMQTRMEEAFNFTAPPPPIIPPKVIAWVTPPKGIDGAEIRYIRTKDDAAGKGANNPLGTPVHKESTLQIVLQGGSETPEVTITSAGNPQGIALQYETTANDSTATNTAGADNSEKTYQFKPYTLSGQAYQVRIKNGPVWDIKVAPDTAPKVKITGLSQDERAADKNLRLGCTASDDYGIKQGQITFNIPSATAKAAPPDSAKIAPVIVPGRAFCNP